ETPGSTAGRMPAATFFRHALRRRGLVTASPPDFWNLDLDSFASLVISTLRSTATEDGSAPTGENGASRLVHFGMFVDDSNPGVSAVCSCDFSYSSTLRFAS